MTVVNACSAALPGTANIPQDADDALAGRALGGERAAMEALVARYRPRIYAFALGLLLRPDDAEDVAQETFLRAMRTLGTYEQRGQFRGWLFRIAANLCRDLQRRTRRAPESLSAGDLHGLAGSSDPVHVIAEAAIVAALFRLPAKYREVMVLRCLEELSPAEIADVLGRPVNLVRVQLWRARGWLARELDEPAD